MHFRVESSKSLSGQNRWLLVELLPSATTVGPTTTSVLDPLPSTRVWKSSTIYHAIKQSVILNFGDAGWGAVGVNLSGKQFLEAFAQVFDRSRPYYAVKYYSPTTQMGIIKVGREHVRIARGAITLLTNIDGVSVLPVVWCCSGGLGESPPRLPFCTRD